MAQIWPHATRAGSGRRSAVPALEALIRRPGAGLTAKEGGGCAPPDRTPSAIAALRRYLNAPNFGNWQRARCRMSLPGEGVEAEGSTQRFAARSNELRADCGSR